MYFSVDLDFEVIQKELLLFSLRRAIHMLELEHLNHYVFLNNYFYWAKRIALENSTASTVSRV